MRHFPRKICIAAVVVHAVLALAWFAMSGWTQSGAIYAAAWLSLFTGFFWFFSYIHMWATKAVEDEEREEREFKRRRGARETEKLFDERRGVEDALSAGTKLRRLEKWFFPGVTLALGICMCLVGYLIITGRMGKFAKSALENQVPALIFLSGISFFTFIFSRYAAGLSEERQSQGLKGSAGGMFLGTLSVLLIVISFILSSFDYFLMERVLRYAISAVICIIGIELILNFILHFYRPRVEGRVTMPVYYSRILGLMAVPTSIFRATAMTLDYQFGFKVSETWFYQFFERAAAPLILFLLLVLYLFTCIVVVQSDEQVIIERFGTPKRPALGPGIHLKLAWPFDKAKRYHKLRVKEMVLGVKPDKGPHSVIIWQQPHHEDEYMFIVAQREQEREAVPESEAPAEEELRMVPVSFMILNIRLQYRIKDVFDYAYNKSEPERMLEDLAYRELVKYCATADYDTFLAEGRSDVEMVVKENISRLIEDAGLGIELLSVNLLNTHPPRETVPDFEAVVGAMEEKEAKELEAEAYRNVTLNEARGTRAEELNSAESDSYRSSALTRADAESFEARIAAYTVDPEIYKLRFRFEAMIESIADARKFIVPAKSKNTEVIVLELQEEAPGVLELYSPKEEEK